VTEITAAILGCRIAMTRLTNDELDAVNGALAIPIVQMANMVRVALYDKMVRDQNTHIYTGPLR
jgi:hypothetical protein